MLVIAVMTSFWLQQQTPSVCPDGYYLDPAAQKCVEVVETTDAAAGEPDCPPPSTGLVGTLVEWSTAAKTGGPWFIMAVLGLVITLMVRHTLTKDKEHRDEIKVLNDAAVVREKKCAEDMNVALLAQAKLSQERYDTLRDESREEHKKRNDEVKEVAVTMTNAIVNDVAAKQLVAKQLEDNTRELRELRAESNRRRDG